MPGARLFPTHYVPRSQSGGLMNYPLSGLVEGAEITFGNSGKGYHSTNTTDLLVDISGGTVILDSERIEFDAITGVQINTGVDLSSTEHFQELYIVPTRLVPYFTDINNPPSVGSVDAITLEKKPVRRPQSTKLALYAIEYDDYAIVQKQFYSVDEPDNRWDTGGAWEQVQDVRKVPYTRGNQNQYPFNVVKNELTASNFALENEKELFHKTNKPPYVTQPSNIALRNPGGFRLATLYYPGDGSNAEVSEDTHVNDLIQLT